MGATLAGCSQVLGRERRSLDVWRCARTAFAYTYRDYVIGAFNDDLPYDQFVRQQLAADQMQLAADAPELAAMGLLTLGRMFDRNLHDVVDDQIDVVGRGILG